MRLKTAIPTIVLAAAVVAGGLSFFWGSPGPSSQASPSKEMSGVSVQRTGMVDNLAPKHPRSAAEPKIEKPNALRAEGTPGLYKVFRRGAESNLLTEQVLAVRAFDMCEEYLSNKQAPNLTSLGQAEWKYLLAARTRMREECGSFTSPDLARDLAAAKRLKQAVAGSADVSLTLFNGLPRNPSPIQLDVLRLQLKQRIDAEGALGLEVFEIALADWLQHAAALADSTIPQTLLKSPATIPLAISIAPCFAGTPCGFESRYASLLCAGSGVCAADVVTALTKDLKTAAEKQVVLEQAKLISAALAKKDWASLALQ